MKIVHVISYFQPKLGYQEYYLAREQQKMGHEVCVITSDRYASFPGFSETVNNVLGSRYVGRGKFMEEGIRVIRLRSLFEIASNAFILDLKKELELFCPDVVHVHVATSPLTMETLILKDIFHYKVVVDCHMDYSLESKSKKRRLLFHIWSKNVFSRKILRKADGFIAVAESARKWLSREWGISYEKIKMIPLGADNDIFSPDTFKRRNMRKKLGLAEGDVLIVYAGKMHDKKDIEVLLHAAFPLIKIYRNVKILLIGTGPKEYMEKLHLLIKKFNIKNNVLFYPFQHKIFLNDYYNAADIGVWPGQDSITIVEAMATSLPVVLPCSERNHHYLEYNNGFHFKRGNSSSLQYCLERLVVNPNLRQEMGLKSSKLVEEKLSWNLITKQTLAFYKYCSL